MGVLHCPICDKPVQEGSALAPFCCERCQRIDLGRWLGEEYGLPYETEHENPAQETDDR